MDFRNTYPDVVPEHKRGTGCCTVYTWSVVFGKPFHICEEYLSRFGYREKKGMSVKEIDSAFGHVSKHPVAKGCYNPNNRTTINKFVKDHPKGRFYCVVRGHAFAIIDGVVYDHSKKPRRQIQHAWRVYLPEEL